VTSLSTQHIFAMVEQGLTDIGYTGGLLRRDYPFANAEQETRIPLAAFAQEPPSYRNACFGVVIGSQRAPLDDYWWLGAPQLLEVADNRVRRLKVVADRKVEFVEDISPDDILPTIRSHEHDWSPDSILRARSIAFDRSPVQLDFYDIGLLPAIDSAVRPKLDRFLRDTLWLSEKTYQEHNAASVDYPRLFRLIFRLLAAKLLGDRDYPGRWLQSDARAVLAEVENRYFRSDSNRPYLTDFRTQQVAWDKIRSSFHLQNISLEALAYIYENTLVDREKRRVYGIHSTPPEVAEYIVQHLPFEDFSPQDRRIFEPFAGHGAFLIAALGRLRTLLPKNMASSERHQYFVDMLTGLEIDAFALEIAQLSLMLADYPNPNGWNVVLDDAFLSPALDHKLSHATAVLCNPPFEDFTSEERAKYKYAHLASTSKAADTLLRVLKQSPQMLGFVLPYAFRDGQAYREARRHVVQTYGTVELVALPENTFQHSRAETVLLIASDRRESDQVHLRTGMVPKGHYQEFKREGQVLHRATSTLARDTADVDASLWAYPLDGIWDALTDCPKLQDVAAVHRGIEYRLPLKTHAAELFSPGPREGFAKGVSHVRGQFEQLYIKQAVFLNMDPAVMRYRAYELPWSEPKVLVNAARLSEGSWVLGAVPDTEGLVASQNFHGIWPIETLSVEVLAAVLNGPVANAFMSSRRTRYHNRKQHLVDIPVPSLTLKEAAGIQAMVHTYQRCRFDWLNTLHDDRGLAAQCRDLLLQIDLRVLAAYDLSQGQEQELLNYFAGARRPGPVQFNGYFPARFHPNTSEVVHLVNRQASAPHTQRVEELITLHQAANTLGMSIVALINLLEHGDLLFVEGGPHPLIRAGDVDAFAQRRREANVRELDAMRALSGE